MNFVDQHLPILQILLPFLSGLLAVISGNTSLRFVITTIAIIASILSLYGLYYISNVNALSYVLGGWPIYVGIEYKLNNTNQLLIVFANLILLFLITCGYKLLSMQVTNFIKSKRANLFYAILFFAHTGYIGIISTNDLFNLYVFIEISSLASYALVATGNDKKALLGAFDYLIFGSIGATFVLIGIGFLFAKTGNLNFDIVASQLTNLKNSTSVLIGISFVVFGCLLKLACFPISFWMIRAYSAAPSSLLIYLASVSSVVAAYILFKFYTIITQAQITEYFRHLLTFIGLGSMIFGSCTALLAKDNAKKVVIYSSIAQIGYAIFLLPILDAKIFACLIVADGLNKACLFLTLASADDNASNILTKTKTRGTASMIIINIICNSGLPLGAIFLVKCSVLDLLLQNNSYLESSVVIITSAIAILYHYNLAKALCVEEKIATLSRNNGFYNLSITATIQLLLLGGFIQYL